MDSAGNIYGLQRIYRDGAKRFIYGTDKRGHFFMIGTPANKIICIAEGYATAATIHELTGLAAVVAFDAGNLLAVSENISTAYPEYELILCADDDRFIEGNPGLTKAKTAACTCGGTLLIPRFADVYSRGTDFNDQFVEEGGRSVLDCFATGGIDNV
jgi:putative DNA primase/helicase